MLPPKNEEDARLLLRSMESYYKIATAQFEEDDAYYNGDIEELVVTPEGFDITIPTTARAIIDEGVDNVEPNEIVITYAARNGSEIAQKDAEAIMKFLRNAWIYWRQSGSDIDVLRDFIKNLFKNGKAIFKVVPDWTLWPSVEDGEEVDDDVTDYIMQVRRENFPVVVRSLSPRHVMEDPSMNSRKLWIIEKYDVSTKEIQNKYAEYEPLFNSFDDVNFGISEIWTATYVDEGGTVHKGKHFTFINDTLVDEDDNIFGDIPYVIKHSGFGHESYDGLPEKKAIGFFTKQVKSMIRAEMRRLTHFDALMQQLAFPIALFPQEVEDIEISVQPGSINYVPMELLENSKNIYLQAQLPAPEYMQSLNMISGQIERGTTQRAVRGAGVPGTDSAAQLGMVTAQAKLRLQPIQRATEEAVDMVNGLVLKYVDQIFKDEVSVFAAEKDGPDTYTVKPKQLKGKYRTRTRFAPSEEQERQQKIILANDAIAKGMNPIDAYNLAGFDNATEMFARNMMFEVMKDPMIMKQLAKRFALDWGLDLTEIQLAEYQEETKLQQALIAMQNGGMPPGGEGGVPSGAPEGGAPPGQGMGQFQQDQANNQAPPQAAGRPVAQPQPSPANSALLNRLGVQ